jgi:hypothetical protein
LLAVVVLSQKAWRVIASTTTKATQTQIHLPISLSFSPRQTQLGLIPKTPLSLLCCSSSNPPLPDPEVLSAVFFFFAGAKFRQNAKNKIKREYSVALFLFRGIFEDFYFLEIFFATFGFCF